MFDKKHQLIVFLVFVSIECIYSKSIGDDIVVVNPKPGPFIIKEVNSTVADVSTPKTTYDWGQWTKTTKTADSQTTYDWGQHTDTGSTYDWGQHTGSGSTYDWGQHTGSGSTYDWGQHTSTGGSVTTGPADDNSAATDNPTGSTYDWGQHTATGSTYDWGQHTGSGSTYDWGQHTGSSGSTYDWGQHTGSGSTYDWGQHTKPGSSVTPGPGDDNSTATENPNDNENGNLFKCPAGKYTCKGTIGLCISLTQICDRKQDCPHRDDENPAVCFPGFGGNKNQKKNYNNFAGTGFMFRVKNIVVRSKSDAKLFNQQSDNRNTNLIQA